MATSSQDSGKKNDGNESKQMVRFRKDWQTFIARMNWSMNLSTFFNRNRTAMKDFEIARYGRFFVSFSLYGRILSVEPI